MGDSYSFLSFIPQDQPSYQLLYTREGKPLSQYSAVRSPKCIPLLFRFDLLSIRAIFIAENATWIIQPPPGLYPNSDHVIMTLNY